MQIPRPEYPRPQFVRKDWLCLNGEWQFEIDSGDSGLARDLPGCELKDRILVPFCPESPLSGIDNQDFMNVVWYRRAVKIPTEWQDRNVLLHFQAVDYDTTVWANGSELRRHRGGFTPFTCYLSEVAAPGDDVTITVRARDFTRLSQPKGKQSTKYESRGCFYTRTTGIWQTVWMEPVPDVFLKRPRITPNIANGTITLEQPVSNNRPGNRVRSTLSHKGRQIAVEESGCGIDLSPRIVFAIPENDRHLWNPGDPHLYDISINLIDANGAVIDSATTYGGLRSIAIEGKAVKINGRPVFQRLVLDQGYYPDGILTAPNDDALSNDILHSMAAGFNGARLHEKVFEERFLYHADRLGYLVWGEFADWGCFHFGPDEDHHRTVATHVTQWLEVLHRDYSHPSIIGWCPMNETAQPITDRITDLDDAQHGMFLATKAIDQTRPVLDTSGYSHRVHESDIYDSHDYEPDPGRLRANHQGLVNDNPFLNDEGNRPISIDYRGQPYFVSEFGGVWWNAEINPDEQIEESPGTESWGYGERPRTIEEFTRRFESLCNVLLDNPAMFGYCYTQLTDVYQEQNGIYTFDRKPKFDCERLRAIQSRGAAIERTATDTQE